MTLQVLAVLLAGLVLGPRDGALSQLAYLAAITAGLPLDARALGPAVWLTPDAGYLRRLHRRRLCRRMGG